MELVDAELRQIMPNAPKSKRLESLPILNAVMLQYDISNERRAAAWLATIAAESGELKYQQELDSGAAYEGRRDLGNTQPGDGRKFKGHGRIQITGRANHASYTSYLRGSQHLPFVDFVKEPQRLAEEPYATDSAGWFWAVLHDLNSLADKRNFLATQKIVNGYNKKTGLPNHWDVRLKFYERGMKALPDDFLLEGAEEVLDTEHSDVDAVFSEEPQLTSEPVAKVEDVPEETTAGVTSETGKPAEGVPSVSPASEESSAQKVQKVTQSLASKVISGGIPSGGVVATILLAILGALKNPFVIGMIILGTCALGAWLYNESKKRDHNTQNKLIEVAASKEQNTVAIVPPPAATG